MDKNIDIHVSDDGMIGSIIISKSEENQEQITKHHLMDVLHNKGIVFGINEDVVEQLSKRPIYEVEIEVAKGFAPIDGEDGYVEYFVKKDSDYQPDYTEEGVVDYKNLDYFQLAKKDQILCKIIKETEGTDGKNIYGTIIQARRGRPPAFPQGQNTVFNEDETKLYAACDGVIRFINEKVDVHETLRIRSNVDQLTGNINFTGDVIIDGDVCDGFSVISGGDVIIKGVVECATIRAAGSIHISNGINGGGRADIYAKGDFRSQYIESTTSYIEGNIYADSIIDSKITCLGNIRLLGSNEMIIGGDIKVLGDLQAKDIGNERERLTRIEVLGIETIDTETIKQLKKERAEHEKNVNTLEEAVYKFSNLKEQLEIIKKQITLLREQINQISYQIQRKEKQVQIEYHGTIVCKRKIYRGVMLFFGDQRFQFSLDNIEHCRIYWHNGDIIQGVL
ncbi:MAG: FapA family protein [Eubacteriales bacterium]|nr:FapA family protein [Eubacteriales bacterium]